MLNLKSLRIKKGISQEKLAKQIGVSRSTIAMWETEGSQPDNDKLIALANYLETSTDYLLGREEKAAPQEEQQKPNTIKILGRDGSCVERQLTDDQIDLMKRMIGQMPDADDL